MTNSEWRYVHAFACSCYCHGRDHPHAMEHSQVDVGTPTKT